MAHFIQQIIADIASRALKITAAKLSDNPHSIEPEQLHYLLQLLAFRFSDSNITLPSNSDKIYSLFIQLISLEIYDHIDGGFFSLTSKSNPQTSDYTKSLSSNADLINLLTKASGHFFEGYFSIPAINSAQWITQNLQSQAGSFFQGTKSTPTAYKYYHIDIDAIKQSLDQNCFIAFCSAFNITNKSLLSSTNKIRRINSYQQIAEETSMHIKQVPLALEAARQQLIIERQNCDPPEICHNICCRDNCKMISTLFIAARQFNRDDFSNSALRALKDIQRNHWNNCVKNTTDYLSMIHALLMRLQFRWDDDDYNRLLQIGEYLLECSTTDSIIQVAANNPIDSTVDDFYNLYFLSSKNQFLVMATSLIKKSINSLKKTSNLKPNVISYLMKSSLLQNFIVIRGSKYESWFWQQQLNSGYKPFNHVYAIPNNSTGPDNDDFPVAIKTQGIVYQFNEQKQNKCSLYQSLDDLLNNYSNTQSIDKKKTP